jgi:hypothetical protein
MEKDSSSKKQSFEDSFEEFLRVTGRHFPLTEDEVGYFEENNTLLKAPNNIPSSREILSGDYKMNIPRKSSFKASEATENLARAARNGGVIPDEILNKMRKDRDTSEESEQ